MNDTPFDRANAFLAHRPDGGDTIAGYVRDGVAYALTETDLRSLLEQLRAAPVPEPFGQWLDEQMRHLNLGAGDIADRAHHLLDADDIADWRCGRTAPNVDQAFVLANALGVSVVDTLGAAGHGHIVCAITDEWDEERRVSEPAVGSY